MDLLKNIDLFGTGIQWKLLSKDSFKSSLGGFLTFLLISLFIGKLVLFIKKIESYGFVKTQTKYQFKDDYQYTNLSDFNITIYTDLSEKIEDCMKDDKYGEDKSFFENASKNFNLTNFLEVASTSYDFKDLKYSKNTLFLDPVNSSENSCGYEFICLSLKKENNFINISSTDTFVKDNDNKITNLRNSNIGLFYLDFHPTKDLIKFFQLTKKPIYLDIFFDFHFVNVENYTYSRTSSSVSLDLQLNYEFYSSLTLRKTSISKKFEFDIFEFEFSKEEKYFVEENSLRTTKTLRDASKLKPEELEKTFIDTLLFNLNIYEQVIEVTFLSFDDIMSVLGGFMQITISFAAIIASSYNENVGRKI